MEKYTSFETLKAPEVLPDETCHVIFKRTDDPHDFTYHRGNGITPLHPFTIEGLNDDIRGGHITVIDYCIEVKD